MGTQPDEHHDEQRISETPISILEATEDVALQNRRNPYTWSRVYSDIILHAEADLTMRRIGKKGLRGVRWSSFALQQCSRFDDYERWH